MAKISLYIPCFNSASTIESCLQGVMTQTRKPDEVLLIDDGCTDRTVEIARAFDIKVIHHAHNRGLAAARNTAVSTSLGDLVASLDSDCVASPQWLSILETTLIQNPNVDGVGGKLVEKHQQQIADKWRAVHMRQHWGEQRQYNPPFLFGNNNVFRKNALLRAGPYDERLRTNFEDVSISEALYAKGSQLIYEPEAMVYHLRRDTVRSILRANWRWRFFGYRNDIDLAGWSRALLRERLKESFMFVKDDLRNRDPVALALSATALSYAAVKDVEYLAKNYGHKRVVGA